MNILPLSRGAQLKKDLGLTNFKYAYIQRIIGMSMPVYVVTIDSKYPTIFLSWGKIKKLKSTWIGNAIHRGKDFIKKELKLTPPIRIEDLNIIPISRSVIFIRDMAGEYLIRQRVYEKTIKSQDSEIKVIRLKG